MEACVSVAFCRGDVREVSGVLDDIAEPGDGGCWKAGSGGRGGRGGTLRSYIWGTWRWWRRGVSRNYLRNRAHVARSLCVRPHDVVAEGRDEAFIIWVIRGDRGP